MTTGYICDRCGAAFESGGKWLYSGYSGSHAVMQTWDLCPDCMEGFTGWMERGLMAEAPEESADCVSSNDGEHATADREHSLESESVRERRYESQDATGSAERVTEAPELLHDTREKLEADIRRFYDDHECHSFMSVDFLDFVYGWLDRQSAITERETLHSHPMCAGSDACPAPNQPISESTDRETPETSENDASKCEIRDFDDTREKLEEDVRTYMFLPWSVDTALDWLDRQAAITERECMERIDCAECAEGLGRELDARCDPLKSRIAELKAQLSDAREALDAAWGRCDELKAERDTWKDAFEDSERMRLELVEQVEYHEALIARLKQRRGELMEQVRKLQDVAARDRLNAQR